MCSVKKCGTDAREYGNCKTGNKGYAEYGYSIFYSNTSKEDLYGSEGEVVKNYFAESSIQHLRNKICSMGKKDREEQIRFIKIILTDLNDVKVEKPKKRYK